jgi:putative transposase
MPEETPTMTAASRESPMRSARSRHTEEEIRAILHESTAGLTAAEICARHGISQQTYYRWKKRHGGESAQRNNQLRLLEDENAKLKRILAEKELDLHSLRAVLQKSRKS